MVYALGKIDSEERKEWKPVIVKNLRTDLGKSGRHIRQLDPNVDIAAVMRYGNHWK